MTNPIGVTEHGDLVFPVVEMEWFKLTPQLRLIMPEWYDAGGTNLPGPILQQAEQGSLGTVRWRTIPVVEVTLAEYEAARSRAPI